MSEFNLNNCIEHVVQSKIEKEVAAMQQASDQKTQDFLNTVAQKIQTFEQHLREVLITFEDNLTRKLNEMFSYKTKELILKIEEEVNKKCQITKEQIAMITKEKLDGDFEQRIILQMDEKIEAKAEEMCVTLQAQIIQEFDKVMAVFHQILNNGLDLDKKFGQELTGKFEVFLDSKRDDMDKVLKEKIEQLLNSKENNFEDKLEVKVTAVLEQSLKDRTASLIKDYEDKGSTAFEQILTDKLNNVQSQNQNNDNYSSLNEHIIKLKKIIENIAKDIKILNRKLEQTEKLLTIQDSRESFKRPENGSYINLNNNHMGDMPSIPLLPFSDFESVFYKSAYLHTFGPLGEQVRLTEIVRMFNNIKTYVVNRFTRFPPTGTFVVYSHKTLSELITVRFDDADQKLKEIASNCFNLQSFEECFKLKWVANGQ